MLGNIIKMKKNWKILFVWIVVNRRKGMAVVNWLLEMRVSSFLWDMMGKILKRREREKRGGIWGSAVKLLLSLFGLAFALLCFYNKQVGWREIEGKGECCCGCGLGWVCCVGEVGSHSKLHELARLTPSKRNQIWFIHEFNLYLKLMFCIKFYIIVILLLNKLID